MRRAVILFAVFAIAVVAVLGLIGARTKDFPQKAGARPSTGSTPPAVADGERTSAASARLAAAGHIKEAQDEYLQALMAAPGDNEAMRWLVAIRRQLMDGNAAALRRQAATFEQAVALGTETEEHYNKKSMRILAQADMRAAQEIEAEQAAAVSRSRTAPSGPVRSAAPPGPLFPSPPPAVTRSTSSSTPPTITPRGQNGAPRASSGAAPGTARSVVVSPRQEKSATTAHPTAATSAPAAPARPTTQSQTQASPSPPSKTQAPLRPPSPATAAEQAAIPVPLSDAQPAVVQSQGVIVRVDCGERSFVLHGPQGDQEYFAAGDPLIYVRGARSERLQEFCGLQRFVGNTALAWSRMEGGRRIATEVSVVLTTQ